MRRTCYAVVLAPDPEYVTNDEWSFVTRTFTQVRHAFTAALALAEVTAGRATITVVKLS